MIRYTFRVNCVDGLNYYPKEFKWEQDKVEPGTGLLEFEWTADVHEAKTWDNLHQVLDIGFEYVNSQLICIEDDIITLVKTLS